jgi:hypothetical protein
MLTTKWVRVLDITITSALKVLYNGKREIPLGRRRRGPKALTIHIFLPLRSSMQHRGIIPLPTAKRRNSPQIYSRYDAITCTSPELRVKPSILSPHCRCSISTMLSNPSVYTHRYTTLHIYHPLERYTQYAKSWVHLRSPNRAVAVDVVQVADGNTMGLKEEVALPMLYTVTKATHTPICSVDLDEL